MKSPQKTPSRGLLAALAAACTSLATILALAQDPRPSEPAAGEGSDPAAAAPAAAQDDADVPLEDYEASEQISEDLSVSFPVDI